jgi:hypothetical protein
MLAVSGGTKLTFLPQATFEESRDLVALTAELKALVPREGRLAESAAAQPDHPLLLGLPSEDRARLSWTFTVQQTCDLLRLCAWQCQCWAVPPHRGPITPPQHTHPMGSSQPLSVPW